MGLSNENPKLAVETIRVLVEIANGFKLLEEYGLEKIIKEANKLSEVEERKSREARDNIAKNEGLLAELKNRQKQLDATTLQHAQTIQTIKEEQGKISVKEGELNQFEKQLNVRDEENRKTRQDLERRERAVQVLESKASQELAKAESARKEADQILSDVKARAENVRRAAGL